MSDTLNEEGFPPALSAEEWAKRHRPQGYRPERASIRLNVYGVHINVDEVDEDGEIGWGESLDVVREDCLPLAALALQIAGPDGTPLFTREDVHHLGRACQFRHAGGHDDDNPLDECEFWSLAERLASLLPPEDQ